MCRLSLGGGFDGGRGKWTTAGGAMVNTHTLRASVVPPGLQAAKSAESAEVIIYCCPPTLEFDRNRIFILLSNLLSVHKSIAYSDGPFG